MTESQKPYKIKNASHKRAHTVTFHLYVIQEKTKLIYTDKITHNSGSQEREERVRVTNSKGHKGSFSDTGNVLHSDLTDGYQSVHTLVKSTGFYYM